MTETLYSKAKPTSKCWNKWCRKQKQEHIAVGITLRCPGNINKEFTHRTQADVGRASMSMSKKELDVATEIYTRLMNGRDLSVISKVYRKEIVAIYAKHRRSQDSIKNAAASKANSGERESAMEGVTARTA